MTDSLNNSFFEKLMSHIMEGVKIPKVQIERAVGPIIGMFIEEVLKETLKKDNELSGEYVTLCAEFPLLKRAIFIKNETNQSTNIDWLMYNKTRNEIIFFELKTDNNSFDKVQLDNYYNFKSFIACKGANFLLGDILRIIDDGSPVSDKYKFIQKKIGDILKEDMAAFKACKTVRIFYLVPEATKFIMEKYSAQVDRVFSFQDLTSQIDTPFKEKWKIVHDELRKLDVQHVSTDRPSYAGNLTFREMVLHCEEFGDSIVIGFLDGIKALKAANLIRLKSRLFKYDLAINGSGKNRIPGGKFLEVIRQLMAAELIVNIEKKSPDKDCFSLTDEQRQRIDDYFAEQSAMYEQAGEDRPDCASITFTWTPGLGRNVTAHINGSTQGCEIE